MGDVNNVNNVNFQKCQRRLLEIRRSDLTVSSLLTLRSSSPATGVIWALRAQSPKKVRNCVAGPSRPRVPKSRKRVEKESEIDYFWTFWTLFRLFFDFFDPRGREAPGTHFRTFFGLWAQRAQMTLWQATKIAMLTSFPCQKPSLDSAQLDTINIVKTSLARSIILLLVGKKSI